MLCNKCKVNQPFQDDSWCLSCSAWESIGFDLVGKWDIPGLRELACEAVVSTARHLKGLRRLSSGLAASSSSGLRDKSKRGAAEALAKPEVKEEPTKAAEKRSPLPRSRSRAPLPTDPKPKEEKEPSEYEDEEEEESEESQPSPDLPGAKKLAYAPSKGSGRDRPPEPVGAPPGHRERGEPRGEHRDKGEHRERDRDRRRREDSGEKKSKRKRRRAGRKHKHLSRLVDNPRARVHRSLDADYWNRPPRDQEGFSRHQ